MNLEHLNIAERKSLILSLLSKNDLMAAKSALTSLKEVMPDDSLDLIYLEGVYSTVSKDYGSAVNYFEKVVSKSPKDAVVLNNLGNAYLQKNDVKKAIEKFKAALELEPKYAGASYNLACAHIQREEYEKAYQVSIVLLDARTIPAAHLALVGDCERHRGHWRKAISYYQKAIDVDPSFAKAHLNLCPILNHLGQSEDAIEHGLQAIEHSPENLLAYKNLGDCYVSCERFNDAMNIYAEGFEINPEFLPLLASIGRSWIIQGEYEEAWTWFQKILESEPDNLASTLGSAEVLNGKGDSGAALELLEPMLDEINYDAEALLITAECYWDEGDAETALNSLERVLELEPQRSGVYSRMGQIYSSSGDMKKAEEMYKKGLEKNPKCVSAISGLATNLRGKCDEGVIDRIFELFKQGNLNDSSLGSLNSALSYYYDGKGEYSRAAESIVKANDFHWKAKSVRGWRYNPAEQSKYIDDLKMSFSQEFFDKHYGIGDPSATPVFIVGMPRSGTTLTEQILGRHSKVLGIGERPYAGRSFGVFNQSLHQEKMSLQAGLKNISQEFVDEVSKEYLSILDGLVQKSGKEGVSRVVDKMPDNYSSIGWILTIFPNAKIIHCKRDFRDVAFSQWQTQFAEIRWASHQDHILERFKDYQRVMNHWREVLPSQILEIEYEDLVANQEQVSRKMFEHIGLPWEDECLKFYDSDRLVRTASISQVRKPIYKGSVQKWKRYEPYMKDFFNSLEKIQN